MSIRQRIGRAWDALRGGDARHPSLTRSYHAASSGRLLDDFFGSHGSADQVARASMVTLRKRARELRINSPIVARYAAMCRDNILGENGITLQSQVPSTRGVNEALSKAVEDRFYSWADSVTPDGRSLLSVLGKMVEGWKIEGEGLVEVVYTTRSPFGLWLNPIDPDLLDEAYTVTRTETGGRITNGVEKDASGRIVAYHVWTNYAGEGDRVRRPIPADRLLALMETQRVGQTRGVTKLAPVMVWIHHFDKLNESLVMLNRVAASKMFTLTPGENSPNLLNQAEDGDELPLFDVAPAEFFHLPRDYKMETIDPGQPTQEFDVLARHVLRMISSGLGVSYASLTGDYGDANLSSQRQSQNPERDGWKTDQIAVIERVLTPLLRHFVTAAMFSRQLPSSASVADLSTAVWHARKWPFADPLKEAQAIELMLKLRLTSRTAVANEMGKDWRRVVLQEIAQDQLEAERASVSLPDGGPEAASDPADESTSTNAAPARVLPLRSHVS